MFHSSRPGRLIFVSILLFSMSLVPAATRAQVESFTFEDFVPATNIGFGAGARALGMGGAFIAIADDATAASWNPAGLAVLYRPQFTIVFAASANLDGIWSPVTRSLPDGSFTQSDIHALAHGRDFNFAAFAYPFLLKTIPVTLQISYQRVLSFSLIQELDRPAIGTEIKSDRTIQFQREWGGRFRGGFDRIMIGLASRPFHPLLLGMTVNLWRNGFSGWDQESEILHEFFKPSNEVQTTRTVMDTEDISFHGLNFHIGAIYEVNSWLRFGGVFKTAFSGTYKKIENLRRESYTEAQQPIIEEEQERLEADLHWPWSVGFGIGIYPSESIRLSADVTWTNWSDARLVDRADPALILTYPGQKPLTEAPQVDGIQLRAGFEWVINAGDLLIPVRLGGLIERLPEPDVRGGERWQHGVTFGIGLAFNPVNIDFALIHLVHDYPFSPDQRFGVDRVFITQDTLAFSVIWQL